MSPCDSHSAPAATPTPASTAVPETAQAREARLGHPGRVRVHGAYAHRLHGLRRLPADPVGLLRADAVQRPDRPDLRRPRQLPQDVHHRPVVLALGASHPAPCRPVCAGVAGHRPCAGGVLQPAHPGRPCPAHPGLPAGGAAGGRHDHAVEVRLQPPSRPGQSGADVASPPDQRVAVGFELGDAVDRDRHAVERRLHDDHLSRRAPGGAHRALRGCPHRRRQAPEPCSSGSPCR